MKINKEIIYKIQNCSDYEMNNFNYLKNCVNNYFKMMYCDGRVSCVTCLCQFRNYPENTIELKNQGHGSFCYQMYNMIIEHIEYLKAETLSEKL